LRSASAVVLACGAGVRDVTTDVSRDHVSTSELKNNEKYVPYQLAYQR